MIPLGQQPLEFLSIIPLHVYQINLNSATKSVAHYRLERRTLDPGSGYDRDGESHAQKSAGRDSCFSWHHRREYLKDDFLLKAKATHLSIWPFDFLLPLLSKLAGQTINSAFVHRLTLQNQPQLGLNEAFRVITLTGECTRILKDYTSSMVDKMAALNQTKALAREQALVQQQAFTMQALFRTPQQFFDGHTHRHTTRPHLALVASGPMASP